MADFGSRGADNGVLEGVDLRFAEARSPSERGVAADLRRRTVNPGSIRKRAFDVAAASSLLVLLGPVLFFIWLAVRLTSRGPGMFWSRRVGRHQRVFMMPKFRTMTMSAPEAPREELDDASGYITTVGAFLRRWSLDELPQLICIVTGDMSFIGPRPLLLDDPAQLERRAYPAVHAVRPGLSGLSQVRGRNLVSPRRKARLDAAYARVRTGAFDLEICARTVATLISGRGQM